MTFLSKLFELTHSPTAWMEGVVWSEDGCTFTITDPASFAQDVLPRYYTHANYPSFARQLNVYGAFTCDSLLTIM